MPALTAPLIAAGASLVGQGINFASQGSMNKKTRKWNEKMYAQQRLDALSDWERQNFYNSPSQQMARLKAAGLNPNFVYGNGAEGNAPAPVRSTSVEAWKPEAARFDAGSVIGSFYDTRIKENSLDLQQQQLLVNAAKIQETLAKVQNLGNQGKHQVFDLQQKQRLADTSAAIMEENLRRLRIGNEVTLNQDERAAALASSTIAEAAERVLTLQKGRAKTDAEINQINAAISNLKKDGELKQFDIDLRKQGINPNDPAWLRILVGWLSKYELPGLGTVMPGGMDNKVRGATKKALTRHGFPIPIPFVY